MGEPMCSKLLRKMAAKQGEPLAMLTNLSDITQEIKYKTIVPYLPDTNGMDINVFRTIH